MTSKRAIVKGYLFIVIGLMLVAGGTWAAFNDIENMHNSLEAGTLDLELNKEILFDVSNLKPGDTMIREFTMVNNGTLNIQKVLFHTRLVEFIDDTSAEHNGSGNDFNSLAQQFQIEFFTSEGKPITPLYGKNLGQLISATNAGNPVDITNYLSDFDGKNKKNLPSGDLDRIMMQLTFVDDRQKLGNGLYIQNKYQGDSLKFAFMLEAFQYPGEIR